MRRAINLVIAALFLCGAYSCRKIIIIPPPHRTDSTLSINLTYPNTDTSYSGPTFELIISEPGGKILLDTIAAYNIPIVATLKTAKPLVDVSAIGFLGLNVYKSVQPEEWIIIPNSIYTLPYPHGVPATITYTNAPQVAPGNIDFASLPADNSGNIGISYSGNNLDISYTGLSGNNIAYVLFPTLGKYSYQPVNKINETISLSQMDTTVKVFFSIPPPYHKYEVSLTGYLDATDITRNLNLYDYNGQVPLGDLQYPPRSRVHVEKYLLEVDAVDHQREEIRYRTFGADAPTGTLNLPFPATPIYTFSSSSRDSMSVSFSQRPTAYTIIWDAGSYQVTITAPPDSTQMRPLPLSASLISKLLHGQTPNPEGEFISFGYEIIPGLDYNGYFLHQTNPVQLTTNPFAIDLIYTLVP